MIIAIDGPAASGKGTLSRRLADWYHIPHLDTGLTFRAVAKSMLDAAIPLDDETQAAKAARNIDLSRLDKAVLSDHAIGEAASRIAVMPGVRKALLDIQRTFANQPGGAVLDGRDIGTVVCPKADAKLYVTASPVARARRRTDEITERGGTASFNTILEDVRKRDERDSFRSVAPLRPAEDAHLLDTTELDIETAFQEAVDLIERALKS